MDDKSPQFMTTRWSVILHAQGTDSKLAEVSLEQFCRMYWFPLYSYVRRRGVAPADAQDLTQSFFENFLERQRLQLFDKERGRFRSFLLASIKNFMANQWQKQVAQKRGGHIEFSSIDFDAAEGKYSQEPAHDLTPDRLFDRTWALTLLDAALKKLRSNYKEQNKLNLFDALKERLTVKTGGTSYSELAEHLGMTESAIKVAVHRLRSRYAELIREQIKETVEDPSEVNDELQTLFEALSY